MPSSKQLKKEEEGYHPPNEDENRDQIEHPGLMIKEGEDSPKGPFFQIIPDAMGFRKGDDLFGEPLLVNRYLHDVVKLSPLRLCLLQSTPSTYDKVVDPIPLASPVAMIVAEKTGGYFIGLQKGVKLILLRKKVMDVIEQTRGIVDKDKDMFHALPLPPQYLSKVV
jgi:hypothetical protein